MFISFLLTIIFVESVLLAFIFGRNITLNKELNLIKQEVVFQGKSITKLAKTFMPIYEKYKNKLLNTQETE